VAGDMVEHRLDDVRLHADLGHVGRRRAPDVVQRPRRQRLALSAAMRPSSCLTA
jgi:hypothetical protein